MLSSTHGDCERSLVAARVQGVKFQFSSPHAPTFQENNDNGTEGFGRDDEGRDDKTDPSVVVHVAKEHSADG